MFAGLHNAMLYAAKRIDSTFLLRDYSFVKSGTAFVVTDGSGKLFLVTNRHILDAGYGKPAGESIGAKLTAVSVEGFIPANGDTDALPIVRNKVAICIGSSEIKFAAEYFEDVGCFVAPKSADPPGHSSEMGFSMQTSDLADDKWIDENLSICDFLAYPGFPPWHDKKDMRPILRTGTISSDPRTNYSDSSEYKGRRVAYEGFSFGGSSGSPMFATQKGMRGEGAIRVSGFREGKLVGINAGHLLGANQTHSGVSYFVKSSSVLDLINS